MDDDVTPGRSPKDEQWWRGILLGTSYGFRVGRQVLTRLPTDPRCKLCGAPFRGAAAPLMRLIGKGPWHKNPKYCRSCFKNLESRRGGLEIECSLLFADVRGSTAVAETMRPAEFRALMDGFYETAAAVLVDHDAIVDKFVGDEVIAIFVPALTGELHASRAVAAAPALVHAMAEQPEATRLRIGVGVHTGVAFVGSVGSSSNFDLTALGDTVNICARLAAAAGAGEILVTSATAQAARLNDAGFERRNLVLRGKSELTPVFVTVA